MKYVLLVFILGWAGLTTTAQHLFSIDASRAGAEIVTGQLKMGNPGPAGKELRINNRYLTLDGKPILPVMGEMHFSRIPRDQWKNVLLKMKACGVNVIASYVIWIHHEEIEGHFDWTSNKDLRAFVQLCGSLGLWVYPRIGPWCHAEVRNGGFPDWLLLKNGIAVRTNDSVYQRYAAAWYRQVAAQLQGLLYKDGGPVIGVQLENEYGRGRAGEPHILWLKQAARKYGIDVPLYTVTGWGNGSVPPYEVVPLWGAYPDEPWADNLNRTTDCSNFQFSPFRNNEKIGNEVNQAKKPYLDYSDYPYLTCEMGVGIENTEHRRLQIGKLDGPGLIVSKIASGSNLVGYYMFAGGSNPHGILTSMEENRQETGSWNTNPLISYDFQAAIRESGALNDSYYEIKKLHYFLNEFGDRLTPMEPVFPPSGQPLQFCVRARGNSAFLFASKYCRHQVNATEDNVQFSIRLQDETLTFPSRPMTLKDSAMLIWPLNFSLGNILLKYATAQPLCRIGHQWIFVQDAADLPEFCFDRTHINHIVTSSGKLEKDNDRYLVSQLNPGTACVLSITDNIGQTEKIIVLNRQQAKQAWLFQTGSAKHFYLSPDGLYMPDDDHLQLFGSNPDMNVIALNEKPDGPTTFADHRFVVPARTLTPRFDSLPPMAGADWLQTADLDSVDGHSSLMHRFFLKTFPIDNPSRVKKATLLLATPSEVNIQLNNRWVNQQATVNALAAIDLTGYVQKGKNNLLLDFPFRPGHSAFAARVIIDYANADRQWLTTDSTWLTRSAYTYPSQLAGPSKFTSPRTFPGDTRIPLIIPPSADYLLTLPPISWDSLSNVYLQINYTGNKARIYDRGQLIGDDFYNGDPWTLGLNRYPSNLTNDSLILGLEPLSAKDRVYFDNGAARTAAGDAKLETIRLIPEYKLILKLRNGKLTD